MFLILTRLAFSKTINPNRFPTFWDSLAELLETDIISCQEVRRELDDRFKDDFLADWIKVNKSIFLKPCDEEMENIKKIFEVQHFHALISSKAILQGRPAADPFVIASAMYRKGTVVTEEKLLPNASRIPNVCAHFSVPCIGLEAFMDQQNWKF